MDQNEFEEYKARFDKRKAQRAEHMKDNQRKLNKDANELLKPDKRIAEIKKEETKREEKKSNLGSRFEKYEALQKKVVPKKIDRYEINDKQSDVVQKMRQEENQRRENKELEKRTKGYKTRIENRQLRIDGLDKPSLKQDLIDSAKNKRDDIKVRAELASIKVQDVKESVKDKAKEIGDSVKGQLSKAGNYVKNNLPSKSKSKGQDGPSM